MDVAATPSEALAKLDEARYDLVLSDSDFEGRSVLAYARIKDYRPATAVVTSHGNGTARRQARPARHHVAVYTENLPLLLGKVAELIGVRAIRRYRPLRQAV